MTYFIKNMVCNRCILAVETLFAQLNLAFTHIELGQVETEHELPAEQLIQLKKLLENLGFELLDDKKAQLIEKIKTIIIDMVHYKKSDLRINHSTYIEESAGKDYTYLSNLFSESTGVTIEKYIIHQKIERAKELLVYGELTLSEIADDIGYSSASHLSAQFKKITGLTPRHFKLLKEKKRLPLDKIQPVNLDNKT